MDLLYKRSNTSYLKILAYKSEEFLSNRHLLCYFPSERSIHICTRFCSQFYHSHHLWLHHCCWPDHSQNSCHKKLELFILLVQECVVTSRIFQSRLFFRFLTQRQTKAKICRRTLSQIRWSENWIWFYCVCSGDKAYPYMMSRIFLISRYRKLDS